MTTTVLPPGASWSMRDVRGVFAQLPAPDLPERAGRWDGVFMGRPSLRWLTAVIAAASLLRGWCGKEIGQPRRCATLCAAVVPSRSRLPPWRARPFAARRRPAVIVDYYRTAKPPVRWVRGELRWLTPGHEIVGLLIFPLGKRRIGLLPFRLTR